MPNPVIKNLMSHRSIRKFKADPIPEETLDLILKAGIRAASAGNLQAYSIIVVDDPEIRRELGFAKAPIHIVALVDQYRMKRWLELNDAPFYNDQIANVLIPFWDATIALQNMVIAAESLGLGTVYVGGILAENVRDLLGAPEYTLPAGLVCIGFPDESPNLRPRLPQAAVVHRNRYQIPTDEEITSFYREKDLQWDDMPDARKEKLRKQGIQNIAQRTTVGHYTEKFISEESQGIWENLRRGKFRVDTDTECRNKSDDRLRRRFDPAQI